jgi:hypothetical protein
MTKGPQHLLPDYRSASNVKNTSSLYIDQWTEGYPPEQLGGRSTLASEAGLAIEGNQAALKRTVIRSTSAHSKPDIAIGLAHFRSSRCRERIRATNNPSHHCRTMIGHRFWYEVEAGKQATGQAKGEPVLRSCCAALECHTHDLV